MFFNVLRYFLQDGLSKAPCEGVQRYRHVQHCGDVLSAATLCYAEGPALGVWSAVTLPPVASRSETALTSAANRASAASTASALAAARPDTGRALV